MEDSKRQLIEQTKQFWQPYSKEELSDEDARQIIENMTGFFKVLKEWKEKENDRTASSGEKNR